jgi:hypothetical protein
LEIYRRFVCLVTFLKEQKQLWNGDQIEPLG